MSTLFKLNTYRIVVTLKKYIANSGCIVLRTNCEFFHTAAYFAAFVPAMSFYTIEYSADYSIIFPTTYVQCYNFNMYVTYNAYFYYYSPLFVKISCKNDGSLSIMKVLIIRWALQTERMFSQYTSQYTYDQLRKRIQSI